MPRIAEGYKITLPKGERRFRVVFTHDGKQVNRSTGVLATQFGGEPTAKQQAKARGLEIWRAVVAGEAPSAKPAQRKPANGSSLLPLVQDWLEQATGATLAEPTANDYALRFEAHLAPYFDPLGGLAGITLENTKRYVLERLKSVKVKTVSREFSALRSLLRHLDWPEERIAGAVAPLPRRGARGTPHAKGRRTKTPLEPEQAAQMLLLLPELDVRGRRLRARYEFAYETSLRPRTICELSNPEHWSAGSTHLRIFDKLDKTGFGRRVKLSERAAQILHEVTDGGKRRGPIFGPGTNRKALKKAAVTVLGEYGRSFQPYDFRRNAITHWISGGMPLDGAQWGAGHVKISTTAEYVFARERAFAEGLEAKRR